MKTLSIIIPVFNSQQYVLKLIKNFSNQTSKDFEVVFVDDGSSDNTVKLLKNKIEKIDFEAEVYSLSHSGVSTARNLGIEKAKGQYIYFMDSDDACSKDLVEKVIDSFRNDMLIFNYEKIDAVSNDVLYQTNICDLEVDKDYLFSRIFELEGIKGYLWNKVFKRQIIVENSLLFKPEIKFCEDLLFVCEYINHIDRAYISSFLGYSYYIYPVQKDYVKKYENVFLAFDLIRKCMKDSKYYYKVIKQDFNWVRYYAKIDRNSFLSDRAKSYFRLLTVRDKVKYFYFKLKSRL